MTDNAGGHFYVGTLPDGRFVAASTSSPYFCVRADTEDALKDRVRTLLGSYSRYKKTGNSVEIISESQVVTNLRPTKKERVSDYMEAVPA